MDYKMNFQPFNKTGTVEGFCLIKTLEKKMTAKGVPYLDFTLADSSGEIGAKLWDYKEEVQGKFELNSLVKVRGTLVPFNDMQQFRIDKIRPVTPEDNVRAEDFVPCTDVDGALMFEELLRTVDTFRDKDLQLLVLKLLEIYEERLLYWPAAFRLHHAVRGGLLYHTLSILRLAERAAEIYPFVDRDLLFTGVILHDFCKTEELNVSSIGITSGYTAEGTLIGHLVRGAIVVERVGTELGIPKETLVLVQHMLISHHGEPEYGAAVRPMFLEAELLAQLDLLDARLYEVMQAQTGVAAGDFSVRQWALENRKIYNHGRKENTFRANVLPYPSQNA